MTETNVILPEEVDFCTQSLRKFEVSELGNKCWIDAHEIILKLNQQAVLEAIGHREEMVKDLLILNDKLKILVHEAICIFVWKNKVLPKLFELEPNPKTTFILYTILFHEATAISLLETILYHENSCEALADVSIDLVDYCAQAVTQLIGLVDIKHQENIAVNINETISEELERQRRDINYKIGMKCLTILSYMIDKLDKLPLGVLTRLVKFHDIPCVLSEILHSKPWLRRIKGFEKIIDDKWIKVQGDGILKVTKTEAQSWFALRQLLFNQNVMQNYEINDFRQRELSKCQGMLNDKILDQLPPLAELKHYLCTLVVSRDRKKETLILEELPQIMDTIISKAKKTGWKKIIEQQTTTLMISEKSEICAMAKRLNDAYNTDLLAEMETTSESTKEPLNVCGNCQKEAVKKCSRCEQVFYCSRECQVKNWSLHKNFCETKK